MIKASNIYKRFSTVEALRGVSLEIARKEIVAIVGASGAGKSTLLHILGTLMAADSGSVEIAGTCLDKLNEKELSLFRPLRNSRQQQTHTDHRQTPRRHSAK